MYGQYNSMAKEQRTKSCLSTENTNFIFMYTYYFNAADDIMYDIHGVFFFNIIQSQQSIKDLKNVLLKNFTFLKYLYSLYFHQPSSIFHN